ncbi:amidohydrolase [Brevibacillus choshinensis]|uniref:Amidohydrolase n=1 Tax=Brevibacillus choshinensis TaxID=54911 RepID=A0ABX7FRJ5_BRECH|nr:amidohydrolase [Brevibacillus choshinensis]QRG68792.1 amidohydrolase [Brevibacillus choshinensis]
MTTIYTNGRFYTFDANQPQAEAVVVRDGRIIDLGSHRDMVLQWGRPEATVKDLGGKMVTPGLIDSHLHMSSIATKLLTTDLGKVTSKDQLLQVVKEQADQTQANEWVQGRGWDENRFTDGSLPTIEELDRVAPHCPIFLTRVCGHVYLVNSRALEIAGYHPDMEIPSGGTVVLDPQTRKPTGLLLETASNIVSRHIPEPTYQQFKDSLRQAMRLAIECGLTSVHTEDLRTYGGLDQTWQLFDELLNQEQNRLRCNLLIYYPHVKRLRELGLYAGYGNETLQIGAVKIFADGSFGGRTALLSEPYTDDPDNVGSEIHDNDTLYELFREARAAHMPIAVHTIGDQALENVLNTLERFPAVAFRDRIIHTSLLRPDQLHRLRRPSIIADIQPRFVVGDFPWVADRIGRDRAEQAYIWKSMLEAGIMCAGGSDAPVEPVEPLLGIHAAVTRRAPEDAHEGYNPAQSLSVEEALRVFTYGGALATNEETIKGTISRGKLADMTVYSQNILELEDADELLKTKIEMTVINGEICYEKDGNRNLCEI